MTPPPAAGGDRRAPPAASPRAPAVEDRRIRSSLRASLRASFQDLAGHLSFRLFLLLFGVMAVLLALHTWLVVREESRQLMDAVLLSASRVSEVVQRSTRTAMLRNQRGELHEMIESIGSQEGMEGVRVFNKQGSIMFSTDKGEVGTKVDLRAEACYRCHDRGQPRPSLRRQDRARIFTGATGHRVLGLINPISNEPDCSSAACHAHSPEQTILGVLDVRMSLAQVDAQLAQTRRHTQVSALVLVLVVALTFAVLIFKLVQSPVEKLIDGTRAVSAGDLGHRIDIHSGDDVGQLAASFNLMTRDLQRFQGEDERWALTLEDKVRQKTEELQRAQAHLMQMDRMASLGKLSATVAHEINNPLAGILTYARLVERDLEAVCPDGETAAGLRRYVEVIRRETRRCGEIVQNLLTFARASGAQMGPASVHEIVDKALALVQHHFDLREVKVERRLASGDDRVVCAPGEIQQALLALLVNAGEAMPAGGGRLLVTTALDSDSEVRVSIEDTGAGIPPEVLPHIFEPFYTTKSEAKGVGLGLAVVYGIMHRHGGRVDVQSHVDVGSTFTLVWPRQPATSAVPAGAGGGSSDPTPDASARPGPAARSEP